MFAHLAQRTLFFIYKNTEWIQMLTHSLPLRTSFKQADAN
jgi:hypothetical protein